MRRNILIPFLESMLNTAKIFLAILFLGAGFPPHLLSSLKDTLVATQQTVTEWNLDALNKTGTAGVTKSGNPKTLQIAGKAAVQFDGIQDGIFLDRNPLANLSRFTLEVFFRPDPKGPHEQRFLHMGEATGSRMLLETRVTEDDQWYLDAFIKSGDSATTLIDKEKIHPIGPWYHIAFVVDGGTMDAYVDGVHELHGSVHFLPFSDGQTSIGVRMNKVSWFKGSIHRIRVTPQCLTPEQFMEH